MRPVDTCTHRVQHYHETRQAYSSSCCRCLDCLRVHRAHTKRQRHRFGESKVTIPAAPAREHVLDLVAAGMTLYGVATATGVSRQELTWLLGAQRVSRPVARAILATPLQVTAAGVRRRVQALLAIGWTCEQIGARAGMSATSVSHFASESRATVQHRVADAIGAAYEAMWTGPETPSRHGIARAVGKGYVPPLAWDDATIDDQRVKPQGMEPESRQSIDSLVAEMLRQASAGTSVGETCRRLGYARTTLERRLYRHGRWAEVRAAYGLAAA